MSSVLLRLTEEAMRTDTKDAGSSVRVRRRVADSGGLLPGKLA